MKKNNFSSPKLSFKDRLIKQQLLDQLKRKQIERETQIKVSGKKLNKEDERRLQTIKQLESELKISLGTKLVGGGVLGGALMSVVSVSMMVTGIILSITIVGAFIGIPLFIIGFLMLIGSGLFALLGIGGGATTEIIKVIKKGKEDKEHSKILIKKIILSIIGFVFILFGFVGVLMGDIILGMVFIIIGGIPIWIGYKK